MIYMYSIIHCSTSQFFNFKFHNELQHLSMVIYLKWVTVYENRSNVSNDGTVHVTFVIFNRITKMFHSFH